MSFFFFFNFKVICNEQHPYVPLVYICSGPEKGRQAVTEILQMVWSFQVLGLISTNGVFIMSHCGSDPMGVITWPIVTVVVNSFQPDNFTQGQLLILLLFLLFTIAMKLFP